MESIMLDKLMIHQNRVDYYFTPSKGLEKYFKHHILFVEYDVNISDVPESILVIPFVANMMPLLWLTDSILWIKDIDRTFYDAIPRIKYAYQEIYPHFTLKGTIVPAKTTENIYVPEREAIQLFSGGVDAHATFLRIKENNPILVYVLGLYTTDISENKVYDADKRYIREFSENFHLKSTFVRSNFMYYINSEFIDKKYSKKLRNTWWHGFQHSIAFISAAIPLAYIFKVKSIYIASSFYMGYRAPCASDPTTDIQFKYAAEGNTVHDGFELTRQQKVKMIVDYQRLSEMHYPLRVCSFNDQNCGVCVKCFRTIIAIIAEGGDLSNFGFKIEGSLHTYYQQFMKENIRHFPVKAESEKYWERTKRRMIENGSNIKDKEFVKWFLNYDFAGKRKKAIMKYRVKYFFPIVKRKIKNLFT